MFMHKFELKGRTLQYVASILVSTFAGTSYMALMWSSSVFSLLISNNSPLDKPATQNEMGSLFTLFMAGSIVGNFCLGPLINGIGRKGSLLIMCVPNCISWIMILFGKCILVIQIARFIMGLTFSVAIAIAIIYIAEIAESIVRGKLSVICLISSEIGAVLALALGPKFYITLCGLGVAIPIILFISCTFLPETPYFYLKQGKHDEAEASLKKLRDSGDISDELKQITIGINLDLQNKGTLKDIFLIKAYRKAFFVVLGLKTLQEFSGGNFIIGIMNQIFSVADTGLDENMQSLIAVLVPLPFTIIISYMVDNCGRKPLLYISICGSCVALSLECIYFLLLDTDSIRSSNFVKYIPLVGLFLNFMFKSLGISSIPYLILGEIFPTNIKGIASGIIMIYSSTLGTLLSFGLFALMYDVGIGAVFLVFNVACVFGLFFAIYFVPETKGKTLAEIQREF